MSGFTFRAVNPEGRTVTVAYQAATRAEAREQLTRRGYRIVEESPPARSARAPRIARRPGRRRLPWQLPRWWRRLAGALAILGAFWTVWGLTQTSASRGSARASTALSLQLQGVKPRGQAPLVFSFPELPLTVVKPAQELSNPYRFTIQLTAGQRPTYGLVSAGGASRRFELRGEPLTAQVPAPPEGGR